MGDRRWPGNGIGHAAPLGKNWVESPFGRTFLAASAAGGTPIVSGPVIQV